MMVALLFYAYCRGIFSSRKIMQACDVTDETNDKRQFEPMLEKAQENVGKDKRIKAASADTGYYSV